MALSAFFVTQNTAYGGVRFMVGVIAATAGGQGYNGQKNVYTHRKNFVHAFSSRLVSNDGWLIHNGSDWNGVPVGDGDNKYLRKAGIKKEPFDGRSFHSLRRRIASKMIIAGTPVTTVSQVLGQTKMDSAKQYLSFDCENLRRCACDFTGITVDGGVFK